VVLGGFALALLRGVIHWRFLPRRSPTQNVDSELLIEQAAIAKVWQRIEIILGGSYELGSA
ncbi:MAG: hypothetical protein ACFCBU_00760, partial [Cyanophyceae cyanobacterium]